MKLIKKLAHIWVVSALVVAWVYFFSKVFTLDFKYQTYVIAFLIAPASEELLYRYVPYKLGQFVNQHSKMDMIWVFGIIANFLFVGIHYNNYPYAGTYWAFAIQGVMGFACYYLQIKYGYWASVALHIQYNLAIYFLISQ